MKIPSHIIFKRSFLNQKNYAPEPIIPRPPPERVTISELPREKDQYEILQEHQRRFLDRPSRILIRISSVFPFEFFPKIIEVEENKITVTLKNFFACSQIQSIDMKDIANVFVETAPIFATLKIITRNFVENNIRIPWLRKKEALYTRNIIEGLRIFSQERIDTSQYELKDLVQRLEALSTIKITMHHE